MNNQIEFNSKRIQYLLAFYGMSEKELLLKLNEGRKRLYVVEDFKGETIKLPLLKKIDEVFNKGLQFYFDFSPLNAAKSNRVFFRKKELGARLTLEDKRLVDSFESTKCLLDSYRVLSRMRSLTTGAFGGKYNLSDCAENVAKKLRVILAPQRTYIKDRDYLKAFIGTLADLGIYVFEFIETWNKRERASIDGFFIAPDVIVLKRQKSYKREIFTLAHEVGHYLLGVETIESVDLVDEGLVKKQDATERWCNDFAFALVAGDKSEELDAVCFADASNDYCHDLIHKFSDESHISRAACFTRLLYAGKISHNAYWDVVNDLRSQYAAKTEKEEAETKKRAAVPKPIISPIVQETLQYAFYKGVINETTFCKHMSIKPDKMEKYLW